MSKEVEKLHRDNSSGSGCRVNETGNDTTTTALDNNLLITLKAENEAWLIKVDALLALYYIIVEDIALKNNSNTGQVNWLSDIRTTEVKWLGVSVYFRVEEYLRNAIIRAGTEKLSILFHNSISLHLTTFLYRYNRLVEWS